MKNKILWITRTAVLLAVLIALQVLTKPMGQLVTGSCVNGVLAISVLVCGLGSGLAIALISPVLAFVFGIAPQILTVPAIMVGNSVYVLLLFFLAGNSDKYLLRQVAAWVVAAVSKFVVLYAIVAGLICGVLAEDLLATGVLKPKMLQMLPATFGLTQLFTALIGGGVALLVVPIVRKAIRK